MKLAFFLGTFPALSLAEIYAVAQRAGLGLQALAWNAEVLLVEMKGEGDVQGMFVRLAGVAKVAEMTARCAGSPTAEEVRALLPQTPRKIFFGISAYSLMPGPVTVQPRRLGLSVKRLLEEEGRGSRFVTSQEDSLSAVVVSTNKLLSERGAEVVILTLREGAYLGRTVWVQPYDEYAARDMGRPERDARAGMLPPKLARMMVNLAQPGDRATLLDPFCGSGTVLQEASLLGVPTLIGTDRDGAAIKHTHANLQWLASFTPVMRASSYSLTMKCADVRTLHRTIGAGTVHVIVTEPYLGPPQTRYPGRSEVMQWKKECEALYLDAFRVFAQLLAPGGRVVMVWPAWRAGKGELVFLDGAGEIGALGFRVVDPLAVPLVPSPTEQVGYLAQRQSLLYQRDDQYVLREIRIFEKPQ